MPVHQMWEDPVTENPDVGDTEIWEFYNFTADAHPMHVHETSVRGREPAGPGRSNEDGGDRATVPARWATTAPETWESGFKDTVIAYPGEVTRIRARFNHPGQFVWHCHIVEHEDNEMMRPYRIGPVQPGQPTP